MKISRSMFLAGSAGATLFATSRAAFASSPQAITVGTVPASDVLPLFIAKDRGFFAKRGLDVTIEILPIAPTVVGAIRGGSIEFGTLTVPALLLANQGGLGLVAASGAARENRKNPRTSVVARTGSAIERAADFTGKHVGVPGFSSVLDIMFRYWLSENKVDPKSVNIVEASFATAPDQLKSGALDAVCTTDPFRAIILKQRIGYKVADYWSELRDNTAGLLWASTGEWAAKNPAAVTAFRASLADGAAFAAKNPDEARDIEIKHLKVAAPTLPHFDLSLDAADLTYFAGVMKTLGMINAPVDAANDLVR